MERCVSYFIHWRDFRPITKRLLAFMLKLAWRNIVRSGHCLCLLELKKWSIHINPDRLGNHCILLSICVLNKKLKWNGNWRFTWNGSFAARMKSEEHPLMFNSLTHPRRRDQFVFQFKEHSQKQWCHNGGHWKLNVSPTTSNLVDTK